MNILISVFRHYQQNRAPMGVYFHAAWLKNNPEFLEAFVFWIDEILEKYTDVYFVTMTQVSASTFGELKWSRTWLRFTI